MSGRRALHVHRAKWTVGVLAAVSVLSGVGWATAPDGVRDRADSSTIAVEPPGQVEDTGKEEPSESLLTFNAYSEPLELRPGVSILKRTDDFIDGPAIRSTAAVVSFEGSEYWAMAAVTPTSGYSADIPAISNRTFNQWVREVAAVHHPRRGLPSYWVYLTQQSDLSAFHGATLVEQSSPARLDQAPTGVPSATGMIDIDGARLCVVARWIPGKDHEFLLLPESQYQGCGENLPGFAYDPAAKSQAP